MQSGWRVACVRIPRFPIGAVWEARAARTGAECDRELPLPPVPNSDSSPGSGGPPSRSSDASALPSSGRSGRLTAPFTRAAPPLAPGHWDERPIALVEKRRLRAVSSAAGRSRVRAGMTPAQARALCAELELLDWDEVAIARGITAATGAFLAASPQVTPVAGAPGMWWIGAHGFDGLGGERMLGLTLRRIARRWHPRARVAIADSCVAARAGSWSGHPAQRRGGGRGGGGCDEICIVPPGGCASFLAAAPLSLIPMEEELRETLAALGLGTAGAFAALGAGDVEQRWGEAGLAAWRLTRGEDRRRPVLARIEEPLSVSAELSSPTETMEPVLFLVRAALDRLVAELVRDGRAAAAVAITLTLDAPCSALPAGGTPHTVTREVRPARALARVPPLFERCRALLDGWTLAAPVCAVTVSVVATMPLAGEQGNLLDASWRDPGAVDAALARLRAELGPNVVVRPVARDEHRPEHAGAWVDDLDAERRGDGPGRSSGSGPPPEAPSLFPAPPTSRPARLELRLPRGRGASASERVSRADRAGVDRPDPGSAHLTTAALRLLESPEPVELEWDGDTPAAMWWRGGRIAITRAVGPERLSGDWWKAGYRRDYWRCRSELGELLIYRDLREEEPAGQWLVQGWYD